MGIEEGTFWDEHWVLYGNQFDNKFHKKKDKKLLHERNTTKLKGNVLNGRRYLQMTYLIKGQYPKSIKNRGTWVAPSVKHLTSAQLMISWLVSLSPMLRSRLTDQSLEPVSILSPSLSLCPSLTCMHTCTHALSLSQK